MTAPAGRASGDAKVVHYAPSISEPFVCGSKLRASGANTTDFVNCAACLRVVVEGLRTQLQEAEASVAERDDFLHRMTTHANKERAKAAALGSQVAAVKALADEAREIDPTTGERGWYVAIDDIRAALESGLG